MVGSGWHCPWLSWVDASQLFWYGSGAVPVRLPGGGLESFSVTNGQSVTPGNYFNNLRLQTQWDGQGNVTNLSLLFPDGSKLVYSYNNRGYIYTAIPQEFEKTAGSFQ